MVYAHEACQLLFLQARHCREQPTQTQLLVLGPDYVELTYNRVGVLC